MEKTIQEWLQQIKKQYPDTTQISIGYTGEGDSFGDFWSVEYIGGTVPDSFTQEYSDLLFGIFDMNDGVDFNNEGSEGSIIIHLDRMEVELDNYYREVQIVPESNIIIK